MNIPQCLRQIMGTFALLALTACGPSLEERAQEAKTPELLIEVGIDMLESVDDQESLDRAKGILQSLHSNYKDLPREEQERVLRIYFRQHQSINKEILRIDDLDLERGEFDPPVIGNYIKHAIRMAKEIKRGMKLN